MELFKDCEQILDELEQAESRVEKIRIEGVENTGLEERKALALTIKKLLKRVIINVEACGGKAEKLGGALVLMDLAEVLRRYGDIFDLPGLEETMQKLEKM